MPIDRDLGRCVLASLKLQRVLINIVANEVIAFLNAFIYCIN